MVLWDLSVIVLRGSFGGSVSDSFGMGECLSNRGSVGISFDLSRSREILMHTDLSARSETNF